MDEEDDIFITQNTFSSTSLPEFDVLDLLLDLSECETEWHGKVKETEVEKRREINVVTDAELEERNEARIPANTKINTKWIVRTWLEWAESRNSQVCTSTNDRFTKVNPNIVLILDDYELNYWMSKFVLEIRKKQPPGQEYPPNTLYQMCCGLQRHMRENGRPELNVFENPRFKQFQDSLDGEMKRLTSRGVGSNKRQAESFSEEQEEKLWDQGLLGDCSPKILLDTLVFLIGKNFGLRSGKENRSLKFSQLTMIPESEKEPEKLVYTCFGEKNNLGGLKHKSVKQKKIEHYASINKPERCLVNYYKKYLSKCPEKAFRMNLFYLAPRRKQVKKDEEWYTINPVGHNVLGNTVREMCKVAGIEGHYNNHSLRATTATRGLEKGIPEKFIMQRTGHRDIRSLQSYRRPDIYTKLAISKAFEGNGENFLTRRKRNSEEESSTQANKKAKSEESKNIVFENCSFFVAKDFNV